MLTSLASRYSRQFASAAARTFSSQGEVVIVTGASSGIGYETAKILGASGYRVIGAARRVEKLGGLVAEIEAAGGTAAACHLDVTDESTYETLFKFADARFGGVDHVFLNAGQKGVMKGPADMAGPEDTASYQGIFDVNVIGTILGMKHGIKALRKRGGGSVITVSSNGGGFPRGACGGELGDMTFAIPYCITSASLDQIVRIAAFYQTENIRVYGIKPGVYASEMIDGFVDDFKAANPEADDDAFSSDFNFFFKGIPGDAKHIGHVVETLVNNTTKYVPGSNISLDNDATYDASLTYAVCDTDTTTPVITLDDLRGYDGGPYESKDERTAEFIANLD